MKAYIRMVYNTLYNVLSSWTWRNPQKVDYIGLQCRLYIFSRCILWRKGNLTYRGIMMIMPFLISSRIVGSCPASSVMIWIFIKNNWTQIVTAAYTIWCTIWPVTSDWHQKRIYQRCFARIMGTNYQYIQRICDSFQCTFDGIHNSHSISLKITSNDLLKSHSYGYNIHLDLVQQACSVRNLVVRYNQRQTKSLGFAWLKMNYISVVSALK